MSSAMASQSSSAKICIIGRLSGPKGIVIRTMLEKISPRLFQDFPEVQVLICGEPVLPVDIDFSKRFPRVHFLGKLGSKALPYQEASLVIGAGRVALEAMQHKKPVLALGEKMYVGPINEETKDLAMRSNFGDCSGQENFDFDRMYEDLKIILTSPEITHRYGEFGQNLVKEHYSLSAIEESVRNIYHEALFESNLKRIKEIPVLMYHRVTPGSLTDSIYNIYVTKEELEKQLIDIKKRNLTPIHFADFFSGTLPKRPVILTFDDGYLDNYQNLYPLLKKYKMKAVIYCLADASVQNNKWDLEAGEPETPLMKPAQIAELSHSGLVEIGSHGLEHRKLTTLNEVEVQRELTRSRRILEKITGRQVYSFCYPYGDHNQKIREMTRVAGYRFGVATDMGPAKFSKDLFCIRRIQIFPNTPIRQFRRKTSGWYLRYRKLKGKKGFKGY